MENTKLKQEMNGLVMVSEMKRENDEL